MKSKAQLTFTNTEAKEDLSCLKKALEYIHPRLYKYTSADAFNQHFDSLVNDIDESISGLDLLSKVSQINAQVNCGHLYTIPQFELKKEVLNKKVMPFYVKWINDGLYIINDCSQNDLSANGSKIISINGKGVEQIIQTMKKGIATDGYIETRKNRLIERYFSNSVYGFDLYYHLHVDRRDSFSIEVEEYGSKQIRKLDYEGITIDERKNRLMTIYQKDERAWFNTPSPQFEVFEDKNYAVLKLNRSFYDKNVDPDFDVFLEESFQLLKEKGIHNLILDIRDNEGGSEHHEMEMLSYLYDQPYKLYEHIFLSHLDYRPLRNVIIERDSGLLVFNNDDEYMRKFSNDLWINNYEYGKNLRLQPPKENVYEGRLFVLINGLTFSSGAALAADLKKTTNAIFIGEESGGVFEGPTGGNSIVIQLPNSKIMVRISPQIHQGYMYQKHPFGRGVFADHKIEYTIKDVLEENDLEMKKAIDLISKQEK